MKELGKTQARSDRVLIFALCVVLATISATAGASLVGGGARTRAVKILDPIVRTVFRASPPEILPPLAADPADAARALLLSEHRCLSEVMYYEARSEGEAGEKAVAEVVFQRLESGAYGHSLCAVVYEGVHSRVCQFSFACDRSRDRPKEAQAWRDAEILAARILAGAQTLGDVTGGATFYHAAYVHPVWADEMTRTARIGNQLFYRRQASLAPLRDAIRPSLR